MIGGSSIVFSRKAVADETFIRNLSIMHISIIGPDASKSYHISIVKICPQGCTRDGSLTLICRSLKQDIINQVFLRICSCLSIRKQDQNAQLRAFYIWKQKNIDSFNLEGNCDHRKTVFEVMGCYYHFSSCQETRH